MSAVPSNVLVRRAAAAATVAVLLLSHAPAASARKFQMSGAWELRRGGVFLPLQFPVTPSTYSYFMMFPNGPVLGRGGVTATGSGPATLRVPEHRFGGAFHATLALAGSTLVQVTTMLSFDGPVAPALLVPGGGPGSFTWCPGDPGCIAGGGMLSTDPPQGAGPRNGRILYRAGANRFGGVMQMLMSGGGANAVRYAASPFQVRHSLFGSNATQPTGGPYSFMADHVAASGFVTQPPVAHRDL